MWRIETTMLRGAGGHGGEGEGYSRRHKEPVDCVYACVRERGEALCCGAWTGTKADSLQMEDREIKKGKEGERYGETCSGWVEKGAGEKASSPLPGLKVGTSGN